jgi:hypothetical protein
MSILRPEKCIFWSPTKADQKDGELFFAFWVYCALITLSESIDGLAKLNPNNNNNVVNRSHISILTSMRAQ